MKVRHVHVQGRKRTDIRVDVGGDKMTDKEFRKLKRADLIEIIYQLQENEEQYKRENARLQRQLADRRIKIENAGSIAEAAVSLNDLFRTAQAAADDYLAEIRRLREQAEQELREAIWKSGGPASGDNSSGETASQGLCAEGGGRR